MNNTIYQSRTSFIYRMLSTFIAFTFLFTTLTPPTQAQAVLNLPIPGTMITPTAGYTPTIIRGLTIHPDNALAFDFIVDKGDENLEGEVFNEKARDLIKYFLAGLTVPKDEMWVNLSPYEQDRIIPNGFGDTKMGRDMLAQDYMLKQLTASLMYPEDELGKKFWNRVYTKAQEQFGTTEIPVNTFNKVWIVPQKAVVYEKDASVFVVDSYLKVMLEEDYVALNENIGNAQFGLDSLEQEDVESVSAISSSVVREILIPEIEREVNEGKTFANLRQIFNSIILAEWYKENLKESLLGQVYVDQHKTKGVDTEDKDVNQKIYEQYVEAFKKGVYNYIKEDVDSERQEIIPRKYFSGGVAASALSVTPVATSSPATQKMLMVIDSETQIVSVGSILAENIDQKSETALTQAANDDHYALASSPVSILEKEKNFYLEWIAKAKEEVLEEEQSLDHFSEKNENDDFSKRWYWKHREGAQYKLDRAKESLESAEEGLAKINEVLDHPDRQIEVAGQIVDKRKVIDALQYIEDTLNGKGNIESDKVIKEIFVGKGLLREKKKKIVVLRGGGLAHESLGFHLSIVVNAFIDEIVDEFDVVKVQSVYRERLGLEAEIFDGIPEKAGFTGIQYKWRNTDDRLIGLLEELKGYVQERKIKLNREMDEKRNVIMPRLIEAFKDARVMDSLDITLNTILMLDDQDRLSLLMAIEGKFELELKNKGSEFIGENGTREISVRDIADFVIYKISSSSPIKNQIEIVSEERANGFFSQVYQALKNKNSSHVFSKYLMGYFFGKGKFRNRSIGYWRPKGTELDRKSSWYQSKYGVVFEFIQKKGEVYLVMNRADVTTAAHSWMMGDSDKNRQYEISYDFLKRRVALSVEGLTSERIKQEAENLISSSPMNVEEKNALIVAQEDGYGGINFNTDLINWQIKRDGNGIPLPMNLQPIEDMQIDGFVPVIINVTPVSLPMLLGLNNVACSDDGAGGDVDCRDGVEPMARVEEEV
ncbi:hypothetical protein MNBD_UNCLBAC01-950 [hydrothermal vent metagenome]|uniref:Uncharacterized protein n=1 Tax=hydrothermal vent metagenome TaxID=652676 RepID=A0A3B1DGK6_9ZZZZ